MKCQAFLKVGVAKSNTRCYIGYMGTKAKETIPEVMERLKAKGWTDRGIGEALEVSRVAVWRWQHAPERKGTERIVLLALKSLERRAPS